MFEKGLVMKVEADYAIVMTSHGRFLKLNKQEDMAVGRKIAFTREDLWRRKQTVQPWSWKKSGLAVAMAALLLVISIGLFYQEGGLQPTDASVFAVVTVDINPSVELSLNRQDKVVRVRALNEDAEMLNLSNLTGMAVEDAVERIVILAGDAGFIDETDLEQDYVLITAVSVNAKDEAKSEEKAQQLMRAIEMKVESSASLEAVNVALIKATKRELLDAQEKKIPAGLYVVQGASAEDETPASVKEYFQKDENVESFEEKGEILEMKEEKQRALLDKFIEKLEAVSPESAASALQPYGDTIEKDELKDALKSVKKVWEVQGQEDEAPSTVTTPIPSTEMLPDDALKPEATQLPGDEKPTDSTESPDKPIQGQGIDKTDGDKDELSAEDSEEKTGQDGKDQEGNNGGDKKDSGADKGKSRQ